MIDIQLSSRIPYLSLLLILVLPLSAMMQSKRDRDQSKAFLSEADKAYAVKDYRGAAEKFGKALLLVPTNPYAYYKKGFAHFNLKENPEAISSLNQALAQGYKPLDIYRVRLFIYFIEKDYSAALGDIEKGLKLAPNDVSLLTAQGEILLEQKSYSEAAKSFEKVIKLEPNSADIYYNLARLKYATGDSDAQAAFAESALAKGTRFPAEAFFLLGDAKSKQKNSAAAIDAFQRSVSLKPEVYRTYGALSELLRAENRLDDAVNVLKQGLRAFPNNGEIYTELSWLYSLLDRPDEAVDAARAGIAILPDKPNAYTNLCRALNETKKYELAIGACNSALKLKPDDGETYFYLGRAFNLTGRSSQATKYYGQAVSGLEDHVIKNSQSPDGWYLLGNAYFADNQRDKAIAAYLKSLELSPKFSKARFNLGIIYVLQKNKPASSAQYSELLPLNAKLAAALKAEIDKI